MDGVVYEDNLVAADGFREEKGTQLDKAILMDAILFCTLLK